MTGILTVVEICAGAFAVFALASLWLRHPPEVPSFARRRASGDGTPQLRQDMNATFLHDRGFLFRRRHWFTATCCPPRRIDSARMNRLTMSHHAHPVLVVKYGPRRWWWFEGAFYWETAGYGSQDVLALIRDRERKNKQRLDRAHMMLNAESGPKKARRETIPREMRRLVYERDGGRCRHCGESFDLQYDHIIPVALGGATTPQNLQLLCGPCNREKGADL